MPMAHNDGNFPLSCFSGCLEEDQHMVPTFKGSRLTWRYTNLEHSCSFGRLGEIKSDFYSSKPLEPYHAPNTKFLSEIVKRRYGFHWKFTHFWVVLNWEGPPPFSEKAETLAEFGCSWNTLLIQQPRFNNQNPREVWYTKWCANTKWYCTSIRSPYTNFHGRILGISTQQNVLWYVFFKLQTVVLWWGITVEIGPKQLL